MVAQKPSKITPHAALHMSLRAAAIRRAIEGRGKRAAGAGGRARARGVPVRGALARALGAAGGAVGVGLDGAELREHRGDVAELVRHARRRPTAHHLRPLPERRVDDERRDEEQVDEELVDEVAGGDMSRRRHVAPGVRASPPGKYECFCSETYSNSRMNALELQNEQRAAVKLDSGGRQALRSVECGTPSASAGCSRPCTRGPRCS